LKYILPTDPMICDWINKQRSNTFISVVIIHEACKFQTKELPFTELWECIVSEESKEVEARDSLSLV